MIALVGACLLLAAAPALAVRPNAAPKTATPSVVRVVFGAEPDTLNPGLTAMVTAREVAGLLFARLARPGVAGGLEPDLLRELPTVANGGSSPDGRVVTLRLRHDLHWHDNRPLTAADVAFTWRFLSDASVPTADRGALRPIAAIEVLDDWTLTVRLARQTPWLLARFPAILPRHRLDGVRDPARDPFHRAPVGSGPYAFDEWIAGSHVTLRAFRGYHGERARVERLAIRFVPDHNARFTSFAAGEADVWHSTHEEHGLRAAKLRGVTVRRHAVPYFSFLSLNCSRPPLDDVSVREALARAVDRDALSKGIHRGIARPARVLLPPGAPGHAAGAKHAYAFTLKAATKLLDRTGWKALRRGPRTKAGKGLSLELVFLAGHAVHRREAVAIQQMMKKIQVAISLREVPAALLYGTAENGGVLASGAFDLLLDTWEAGDDASELDLLLLSTSVPPAGRNFARLRDTEIDKALEAAAAEGDAAKRQSQVVRAQELAVRSGGFVPLLHPMGFTAVRSRVSGVSPHPVLGVLWNANRWRVVPTGRKKEKKR